MKTCTKCAETKPFSEFHKKGNEIQSRCKVCRNDYNREKAKEIGHDVLYRLARDKNPEAYKKRSAEYYQKNSEKIKSRSRNWSVENSDRKKQNRKSHYEKNKDKYKSDAKSWAEANPERRKKASNEYSSRFNKDPANIPLIIARKLLSRIVCLTGKRRKTRTEAALGYSASALRTHIEFHFKEGMSWSNHGLWHIDHIIPVSEMIALGINCPKKINALKNLRPIWASENLSKKDNFDLSSPMGNL